MVTDSEGPKGSVGLTMCLRKCMCLYLSCVRKCGFLAESVGQLCLGLVSAHPSVWPVYFVSNDLLNRGCWSVFAHLGLSCVCVPAQLLCVARCARLVLGHVMSDCRALDTYMCDESKLCAWWTIHCLLSAFSMLDGACPLFEWV